MGLRLGIPALEATAEYCGMEMLKKSYKAVSQ